MGQEGRGLARGRPARTQVRSGREVVGCGPREGGTTPIGGSSGEVWGCCGPGGERPGPNGAAKRAAHSRRWGSRACGGRGRTPQPLWPSCVEPATRTLSPPHLQRAARPFARNCQRPRYTKTAILAHAQQSLHGITEQNNKRKRSSMPTRWQRCLIKNYRF